LTSTQYNLLEALQWAPEARTSDVAGALAMDSTTVTRSLKLLENAGWIQFQEGVDLREKRWTLTRKGRAKLDSARPCWQQAQDQVEKILGAKQREQLQDLSFKLVKALAG
jgi:DNA-binding MarR family transcriptional regulator